MISYPAPGRKGPPPYALIYPTLEEQLAYALGPRPVKPLAPGLAARLRPLVEQVVREILARELPEAHQLLHREESHNGTGR